MRLATVASFNVALIASTGRFNTAISKAERQWNSFAKTVQRGAKQMPEAIQAATPAALTLARTVTKVAAAVGATLSGFGIWGVKLQAQFEQTQIAFETLLGSAEAAQQFLGELEKQARRTPFGFTGLQEQARKLLAFGFTAEKVLDMITPIGDTVAAMGGNQQMLEAIIRALGQMQAKQKVSAEEMLQLTEAGVGAWQMLADGIGVSVPEAMKMASQGMISASVGIDAILQGMTKRFGGAMQRQTQTIAGQWDQLKDSMTIIARGMGQDIIRITGLAKAMQTLNNAVGRFADLVSDHGFLGALSRAFPAWVRPVIIGIAGAIGGALVPVIVSWLIPALKKLSKSIIVTLRPLLPWMAIGAALAVTIWLVARHWQAAWSVISASVLYGASIVTRGVAMILSAVGLIIPGVRTAAEAVHGWADTLKSLAAGQLSAARTAAAVQESANSTQAVADTAQQAAQSQEELAAATEQAAKAAQDNLQSFDEVHSIQEEIASSPAAELAALEVPSLEMGDIGFGGMGAAIGEMASQMEEVAGRLSQAWQRAVETLRGLWDSLKQKAFETFPWLQDVVDGFAKAADWVRDNWSTVGPVLEGVAGVLAIVAAAFWAVNSPIGAVVAGGLLLASLAAALIANWETVGPCFETLWDGIKGFLIPIWESIKNAAVSIWTGLKTFWASWGDTILALTGGIWREIRIVVETALNLVKHTIGLVLAVISGDWEAAWTHIKGIGETVWNFIVRTWENIKQTGIEIWQSLQDNIQQAWEAIHTLTTTVWTNITAWLSSTWESIRQTVATVWDAISGTISSWWNAVESGTKDVWNSLTGWLGDTWNGISLTASRIWAAISDTMSGWWQTVRTSTESVWNTITGWLSGVWNGISSTAATVWSGMWSTIGAWWDRVQSITESTWSSIESTLSGIWESIKSAAYDVWRGVANTVIRFVNGVIGGINQMIKALNRIDFDIPDWVPVLGGKSFGLNLRTIDTIPYLARGGNIVGSGAAVVGEAGAELVELPRGARVTPLSGGPRDLADDIAQAVYRAVMDAMKTAQAITPAGASSDREITLRIDGRTFARAILPALISEGQRQGLQLVARPQGV